MELPKAFVQNMQQQLGDHEAAQLCCALCGDDTPVSIRFNPLKWGGGETAIAERAYSPVPWCKSGYYLPERPAFTLDPLFHAGCYYVQEASSMFIEQAWHTLRQILQTEGEADAPCPLLDLCAAPGGKSTLWRTLLPDGDWLVANEPNRQRAEILNENLIKWGHPRVRVTNAYAADFAAYAPGRFRVVAADVPCSGEGMFRKDVASRCEWSPENVEKCAALQRSIIEDVWPALQAGGFLIYSTCTFNAQEDEDNVRWIVEHLGASVVPIPVAEEWGIVPSRCTEAPDSWGYHFYPHRARGEGFFLCLLRKSLDHKPVGSLAKERKEFRPTTANYSADRNNFSADRKNYRRTKKNSPSGKTQPPVEPFDQIRHFDWMPYVRKGSKEVPQHVLAMNPATACQFPQCELTLAQALSYLRRESLCIDAPLGFVVVCYQGHPLGFVNNLGSRANNLYPQEWRIRHL